MSLREKLAWVSLLATLLIWGSFAAKVLGIGFAPGGAPSLLGLTLRTIVIAAVVEAVLYGVLAASAPAEIALRDERELGIRARAVGHAFFAVNVALFGIAWLPFTLPLDQAALAMGCAALFAMAIGEAVLALSQIIAFRIGA